MSDDEPEKVVPIRPELAIEEEGRIRALLDHFIEALAGFERANGGEKPKDVAFVIIGEKGTGRRGFLIEERTSSTLAWAALLLQDQALNHDG